MANFEIDEEVLVAFLKGELDAAEAEAVEAWYDRSAANRRMLGQVYYILYVSDRINDAAGIDVERSLRQFKRRMHAGRRISLRRSAVRIAAAAVVAAVLLAGGLTTVLLSKRLAQPVTVVTQLGERSQVVLPDGTKVWLNSSSSVEYVAPFFSAWTSKSSAHVSTSATTTMTTVSPPSCSKVPSRPLLRDTGRPRYACTPRSNWSSTPGRTPCA